MVTEHLVLVLRNWLEQSPTSTTRKSTTGKRLSKKNSFSSWTSTASPMTSVTYFADSAVRFTDLRITTHDDPTDESVGYSHSSAGADSISFASRLALWAGLVTNTLRTSAKRTFENSPAV